MSDLLGLNWKKKTLPAAMWVGRARVEALSRQAGFHRSKRLAMGAPVFNRGAGRNMRRVDRIQIDFATAGFAMRNKLALKKSGLKVCFGSVQTGKRCDDGGFMPLAL